MNNQRAGKGTFKVWKEKEKGNDLPEIEVQYHHSVKKCPSRRISGLSPYLLKDLQRKKKQKDNQTLQKQNATSTVKETTVEPTVPSLTMTSSGQILSQKSARKPSASINSANVKNNVGSSTTSSNSIGSTIMPTATVADIVITPTIATTTTSTSNTMSNNSNTNSSNNISNNSNENFIENKSSFVPDIDSPLVKEQSPPITTLPHLTTNTVTPPMVRKDVSNYHSAPVKPNLTNSELGHADIAQAADCILSPIIPPIVPAVPSLPIPTTEIPQPLMNNSSPSAVSQFSQNSSHTTAIKNILQPSVYQCFDIPLTMASPLNSQQHSTNGFTHIASLSNIVPLKLERPTSPINNFNHSSNLNVPPAVPSIFDPLPICNLNSASQLQCKEENLNLQSVPKPNPTKQASEGLINHTVQVDKKISSESAKPQASNFASAFKAKSLKNASSWSSLAQASSPQNISTPKSSSVKTAVKESFQAFKKQAKEKKDRERALKEQEEFRRHKKELAEKERMRQENVKRKERDDDDELEKNRKCIDNQQQRHDEISKCAENSDSSNHLNQDKTAAERLRQRLREQERRRREAMAGQIDLNMQSELMAAFEESL